ncbi:hypothetical protein AX16_006718 [Volvariella volvacea WC 439]|nr:hypothetical protein AX16_006718 [Volvariella volvacea WC 439]
MPARVVSQPVFSLDELPAHLSKIFDQAQVSTANHQKNYVALYKLHSEAEQITESVKNGRAVKLIGERRFEDELIGLLVRVLPVKKGVVQADRIIKFIGGYAKFINEKVAEEKAERGEEDDDEEEEDDTLASRFIVRLLKFLLGGFEARDKSVRYRVLSTVAEMIAHLGGVEEDIYRSLRAALIDRITDREPSVRVQAVIALSKLCGSEDPDEVADGEKTVLDILLETLAYDGSAEVRRATLLNIPVSQGTMNAILDRSRDTDTMIRKLVYHAVLQSHTKQGGSEVMGPTHPRALSIEQRELIVKNGLGDREPSVRLAAGSLLGNWVDVVGEGAKLDTRTASEPVKNEEVGDSKEGLAVEIEEDNKAVVNKANGKEKGRGKPKLENIEAGVLELLKLFDLSNSTIAADALLSIFATRPETFDNLEFGESFWATLTPERAFLARVFVDHCLTTEKKARLEALPVVTALAFRIQQNYNELMERIEEVEEFTADVQLTKEEEDAWSDERNDREFIIGEMLALAVNLDYSDEIGRRKMFQLMRDMLSRSTLPDSLVMPCLDVLRELTPNEREIIRIVVELVQDLRDTGEEEEDADPGDASSAAPDSPTTQPVHEPAFNNNPNGINGGNNKKPERTPEEQARIDKLDLRCLKMIAGVLERVYNTMTMDDHSTLNGVYHDVIVPSIKRKEPQFRNIGQVKMPQAKLAINFLELISRQAEIAPEPTKLTLIKIMFDILMVHNTALVSHDANVTKEITNYFVKLLDSDPSDSILALLSVGISKLVLSRVIVDDEVVRRLIRQYFSPSTYANQELRQCLTFFFPVYCYSSPLNQRTMAMNFVKAYIELRDDRRELEDPQDMISPSQIAAQLVDWTDPLKLTKAAAHKMKLEDDANAEQQSVSEHEAIQVELAAELIQALCTDKNGLEKEDKKIFCQLLGKLHIPDQADEYLLKRLRLLIYTLRLRRPIRDTVSNNALTKFESMFLKKFEKQLEDFSEEEYRKLERLQGLFEFLDSISPMDDDEVVDIHEATMSRKRGRKRSESLSTTSSSESEEGFRSDTPPPSNSKKGKRGKAPSKRRRLSEEGDEEEKGENEDTQGKNTPQPSAPTRVMPKRAATKKPLLPKPKPRRGEGIDDEEDNESEESEDSTETSEEEDEEDEEEGEEEPRERTPAAARSTSSLGPKQRQPVRPSPIKEEDEVENSPEHPYDSIIDGDDEEEEDEVNESLLVGE